MIMCRSLVTRWYLQMPFTVRFMSRDLVSGQRGVGIWLPNGKLWHRVMSRFSLLMSGRFGKATIRAASAARTYSESGTWPLKPIRF